MTRATFPAEVLQQHSAVLGKTGSGKTSTAKLMVEQVAAERGRICIIDPTKSDWWGLTSSADGKKAGLPFSILGGPRRHVGLPPTAGAAIGELVATGQLPLSILDMADFPPGAHSKFFASFADTLMRKMRGVLHLVIEEAHEFAPKERSGMGDENTAIYYAKKLATAGRSKGIRLIVCSQRVQALHNALLGSCETLVVHRFTAPADQKPVADWLKGNVKSKEDQAQIVATLPRLKDGQGWMITSGVLSPSPIQFPRITTFDNSATPTADSGEVDVKTAAVDQVALQEILGKAAEEAAANDPAVLKERVKKLEAELKGRPVSAPVGASQQQLAEARNAGREEGWKAGFQAQQMLRNRLSITFDEVQPVTLVEVVQAGLAPWQGTPQATVCRVPENPATRAALGEVAKAGAATVRAGNSEAAAADRRALIAMAQNPEGLRPRKLAILADLVEGGSTWRRLMARFRRESLIDESTGLFRITSAGLSELGQYELLPTGAALRAQWRSKLTGGASCQAIFDAVLGAYPRSIDAIEVANAAGVEHGGSTWRRHMAYLRGLELVSGSQQLTAAAELFE